MRSSSRVRFRVRAATLDPGSVGALTTVWVGRSDSAGRRVGAVGGQDEDPGREAMKLRTILAAYGDRRAGRADRCRGADAARRRRHRCRRQRRPASSSSSSRSRPRASPRSRSRSRTRCPSTPPPRRPTRRRCSRSPTATRRAVPSSGTSRSAPSACRRRSRRPWARRRSSRWTARVDPLLNKWSDVMTAVEGDRQAAPEGQGQGHRHLSQAGAGHALHRDAVVRGVPSHYLKLKPRRS